MKDYRLFQLDNAGHIVGAVEFYCASDEEALNIATRHENRSGLELWRRAQRIQVISPTAVAVPA